MNDYTALRPDHPADAVAFDKGLRMLVDEGCAVASDDDGVDVMFPDSTTARLSPADMVWLGYAHVDRVAPDVAFGVVLRRSA